ncbi:hypothetical protein CE91St36_06120 [Christensenellaceae bacterium]|nr:hypothetical protein CE91St36_06120 [Christensenellaceae bacterium]BDF60463.1 hypothetical protein CE91St37_06130 [Christensenellaceae bacterium]
MDNQDLIPEMDFEPEELAKRVRQHRIAGVIIAVCLIVMGLLMVFMPFLGSVSINNTLGLGVLLLGVYELIIYFRTAAAFRNAATLISGFILAIMGVVILVLSLGDPASQIAIMNIFTIVLGFVTIYRGFLQMFACRRFRGLDEKDTGWLSTSGILNIVLGIIIVVVPFTGWLTSAVVIGIYLAIAGVALLTEAMAGKTAVNKR